MDLAGNVLSHVGHVKLSSEATVEAVFDGGRPMRGLSALSTLFRLRPFCVFLLRPCCVSTCRSFDRTELKSFRQCGHVVWPISCSSSDGVGMWTFRSNVGILTFMVSLRASLGNAFLDFSGSLSLRFRPLRPLTLEGRLEDVLLLETDEDSVAENIMF